MSDLAGMRARGEIDEQEFALAERYLKEELEKRARTSVAAVETPRPWYKSYWMGVIIFVGLIASGPLNQRLNFAPEHRIGAQVRLAQTGALPWSINGVYLSYKLDDTEGLTGRIFDNDPVCRVKIDAFKAAFPDDIVIVDVPCEAVKGRASR